MQNADYFKCNLPLLDPHAGGKIKTILSTNMPEVHLIQQHPQQLMKRPRELTEQAC